MPIPTSLKIYLTTVALTLAIAACSDDGSDSQWELNDDIGDRADAAQDVGEDAEFDTSYDAPDAPDDAGDAGDSGPDVDADADDADDADLGIEPSCPDDQADCDNDGLTDCEEEQLGTEVCEADTDGDGLNDMQELLEGSDPHDPDTDGDGLEDGREVELGLDPRRADSFGDGIIDSERWFVTACDDYDTVAVDHHTNAGPADWRLALAPSFGDYTELTVAGADIGNLHAAAVYNHATLEVAGGLFSAASPAGDTTPHDLLSAYSNTLGTLGTLDENAVAGEFRTHDLHRAAIGSFDISLPAATSAQAFRDELIAEIAPFDAGDISGLPTTGGAAHNTFSVFIAAVVRESNNQSEQTITSIGVAPKTGYDADETVRYAIDDLTNTTQLAEADASTVERCDLFEPRQPAYTDFYWVIDHTSSMSAHADDVHDFAADFYDDLSNTGFAAHARVGVTTMELSRSGHIDADTGWQQDRQTFLDQVDAAVDNGSSEQEPHGLQAARHGIWYMQGLTNDTPADRERTASQGIGPITIFVTDKEAQLFRDQPLLDPDTDIRLDDFTRFFQDNTITFSLTGDGENCGQEDGQSYRLIAQATGGAHGSLCSADMSDFTDELLYSTSGTIPSFELPDTPIPGSLRVILNDEELTRSRADGYDYFADQNAIALFGDARPEPAVQPAQGRYLVVIYETFTAP